VDSSLTLDTAFLQALRARLERYACLTLEEVRTRGWASANFRGARHELALRFDGETAESTADALLADLRRQALALRGQTVADLHLAAEERRPRLVRLRLEALTVCC
jgi:hypothetical protein